MANVIKEYLVKLGFQNDEPAFLRLTAIMSQAEQSVTQHTGGMLKRVMEAQFGIVGAFAAISGSIVSVVDKAAMLDQSWRLMGLRMMMTTESARKYDLITKMLGADLATILRDPELHARAVEMGLRIDKVFGGIDSTKLKGIRDIRAEFSMLGSDLQALGMHFAVNVFSQLFPSGDGVSKIKSWMTWFEGKIPEIGQKLATYAVPILKETWSIFLSLGEAVKAGATAFSNIIGLLSGDTSIQGTAFSFEKLAKAIERVAGWLTKLVNGFTDVETTMGLSASALTQLLAGNPSGAAQAAGQAVGGWDKKNPLTGEMEHRGGVGLNLNTAMEVYAGSKLLKWGKGLFGMFGTGAAAEGAAGAVGAAGLAELALPALALGALAVATNTGGSADWIAAHTLDKWFPKGKKGNVQQQIVENAKKYGVSPTLALAVAEQESNYNQSAKSGAGAVGVMQLMPSTAKDLGVDPNDADQNVEGGVRYLSQLLKRYGGDESKALAAYNAGMGKVDRGGPLPLETRGYVPSVQARQQRLNVTHGGIYITQPGASPDQIRREVAEGVRQGLRDQTTLDMTQLQPAY